MLIVEYIIVAALVVGLSILASRYIDMLDKTTSLSGAFLGGVLLSAVTSLPELFTSVSATLLLHKPSLCIGNILGSDLFNTAMLSVVALVCFRGFSRASISKGNFMVALFVSLIYGVIILDWMRIIRIHIGPIDVTTFIILALYIFSVRFLASDSVPKPAAGNHEVTLSLRQIVFRFVLVSIGIVLSSILMTYITDDISREYNIGAGLAGAIFLGVATSLPEVSSTIALFRLRNYNIAVGNIIGSNLFNFFVLCVADLLSWDQTVYTFADAKVVNLVEYGAAAALLTLFVLRSRRTWIKLVAMVFAVVCYFEFLLV